MPATRDTSSSEAEDSPENKLDEYKYSKLRTPKSIRLLALQPGRKSNDINCELIEVQLETEDRDEEKPKGNRKKSPHAGQTTKKKSHQTAIDHQQSPAVQRVNGHPHSASANGINGEEPQKWEANGAAYGLDDAKAQKFGIHDRKPSRRAILSLTRGLSAADLSPSYDGFANELSLGTLATSSTEPHMSNAIESGARHASFQDGRQRNEPPQEREQAGTSSAEQKKKREKPIVPFLGDPGAPPEFEAVSWSWGTVPWDSKIYILEKGVSFQFPAPKSLVNALKALRHCVHSRVLWIDVICIDQQESDERNRQVSLMSEIYGQAQKVCVWLGDEDTYTKCAFDFIQDEVIQLQDFDKLCNNPSTTDKWNAMLNVMKRPWFSRRWVVQDIALAREATIYCGRRQVPWNDFADAVQLMVEVEDATHRLSEVIQKDPKFYHIPRWFDYVSALGASLLVDATGTLFRMSEGGKRHKLLSLEYLVSKLSIFQAQEPHDTIYALLAIAKDTSPVPILRDKQKDKVPGQKVLDRWGRFKAKRYEVDYSKSYVDICQQFIDFAIHQQAEKTRALDIICRPWAPPSGSKRAVSGARKPGQADPADEESKQVEQLPSWVPKLSGAAYGMFRHPDLEMKMGRQNADSLVGLPSSNQRNYSAAGDREISDTHPRFKKRDSFYSMSVIGFILDKVKEVERPSQNGNIPGKWLEACGWNRETDEFPGEYQFEEFWRTLVADRARGGRNPPTYYARACKMSLKKGLGSGALNTTELIDNGRCSVVAEFFRRVQAVIWNRSLMHTEQGNLGIVHEDVQEDDLVCILHGCSVPVILRPVLKSETDHRQEEEADQKDFDNELVLQMSRKYIEKWKRIKDEKREKGIQRDHHKKYEVKWNDGSKIHMSRNPDDAKNLEWLRKNPRSFYCEVLGECYVHRAMDGEALDIQSQSATEGDSARIRDQVFELR